MRERGENQDEGLARVSRLYRAHGLVPTWERVWDEGVDVTHQPPSTWGCPYGDYVSGHRGEVIRQRSLAWHGSGF